MPRSSESDEDAPALGFPVVAIGASAGGLEPISQVLSALPAELGIAVLVVQHLDPTHESQLPEILGRRSNIPVVAATDGARIAAGYVYAVPGGVVPTVVGGRIRLHQRPASGAAFFPIDELFRTLARDQRHNAIAVILSGTGSDGTLGAAEIKSEGGIVLAQDEKSSKFAGMPSSAAASGFVDFVLRPPEIGRRLASLVRHPFVGTSALPARARAEKPYQRILGMLRARMGVDFTEYRDATIRRRILRRMILRSKTTLRAYADLIEVDDNEAQALFHDVLINVTSFFRDPKAFDALKTQVFPRLLKARPKESPWRFWVAGCSTGEEAYSLAIAALEFFEKLESPPALQVFATDINDERGIQRARAGLFPPTIERDVSPERLARFFEAEPGGYRVRKFVRDLCVFARHNLAADPPFSRMDLISCRNVLIYLTPPLQRRVFPILHYALNPGGYLLLGSAESVGPEQQLFDPVDTKNKIFRRRGQGKQVPQFVASTTPVPLPSRPGPPRAVPDDRAAAERLLLDVLAPAWVIVDGRDRVLEFQGRAAAFLHPPEGAATMNLFKLAGPRLGTALQRLLREARKEGTQASLTCPGVRVAGRPRDVRVEAIPLPGPDPADRRHVVLFGALRSKARSAKAPRGPRRNGVRLELEVEAAHTALQAMGEQHDAVAEELRSTNEELQSSNEELQSTIEELQTSKEELQSTNEELATVNDQLQQRNADLLRAHNDLNNVLASSALPIVIVGPDLRIRRFTPPAGRLFSLIATDVGRPLSDLRSALEVPDLDATVQTVIRTLASAEREVRDRDGRWYLLRIHAYRASDGAVEGAVVVATDIDATKQAERQQAAAATLLRSIVDTVPHAMLVLDKDLHVKTANAAFLRQFKVAAADTMGRALKDLGIGQWNLPRLLSGLSGASATEPRNFEIQVDVPGGGERAFVISAARVEGQPEFLFVLFEDVTAARDAERALRNANAQLERRAKDQGRFVNMVAHEVRTPLTPIILKVATLRRAAFGGPHADDFDLIERNLERLNRVVTEILERVGKDREGEFQPKPVPLDKIVDDALALFADAAQKFGIRLERIPGPSLVALTSPDGVSQILVNLLSNAMKYTFKGGRVTVGVHRENGLVKLEVADTGMGFTGAEGEHLFEAFANVHPGRSGTGLGLYLSKSIADDMGASLDAKSEGREKGAVFTLTLPRAPET